MREKFILSGKNILIVSLFIIFLSMDGVASELHYSLFKKESKPGPTLLIIGGIHGNEPGGFFAPMLFVRHYRIQEGNVWIVPNLNFDSIVRNRRGVYGDMNRKFHHVNPKDADFQIVSEIKKHMLEPQVDLILNLHDGHGFYREKTIDMIFNPKAWGQACIIDQKSIPGVRFGNLQEIAKRVSRESNILLKEDVHEFNVKNTKTRECDEAMRQSLTYFAIQNGKPAFAVETSKNISDLSLKVFYQLKTIEEFMKIMKIAYSKDFYLDVETIQSLLADYGKIMISDNTIYLSDLRDRINYFPVDRNGMTYKSDNPLVAVIKKEPYYVICNGNIPVSKLYYEIYDFDESLKEVDFIIDGAHKKVGLGSIVLAKDSFKVAGIDGYRVNIIGFSRPGIENEENITVAHKDIESRFSIDKSGRSFRVEFYKGEKFCGMIIVTFQTSAGEQNSDRLTEEN